MDNTLLRERVLDTAELCEKSNRPRFLGFLTDEQSVFAERLLEKQNVRFCFFGGFENAQRQMLGCFPDWAEETEFPILGVTARFNSAFPLSHRDVLGSLMGLGLKREAVGDILIEDGRAVIFLSRDIADYVLSQLTKIGRVGVDLEASVAYPLPQAGRLEEFSVTVASERLDCVVSALGGISRSKAAELIEMSMVSVNSVPCEKITARVSSGDILSIRKKGKFIIESLADKTRKDRIILKYKRYV